MSASSRSRSSASAAQLKSGFQQSASPASRFYSSTFSSPAANPSVNVFATSSSSFAARSTSSLFTRSSSPTRVNLIRSSPSAPSVRFSLDRPSSPSRSISAVNSDPIVRPPVTASVRRKTCMCSPTTHPGSFRCSFHKAQSNRPAATVSSPANRLKRAAMTNSLVRIGTVEGEIVKSHVMRTVIGLSPFKISVASITPTSPTAFGKRPSSLRHRRVYTVTVSFGSCVRDFVFEVLLPLLLAQGNGPVVVLLNRRTLKSGPFGPSNPNK